MLELIRKTPLGQAIRLVSWNRLLRYPEELPDFELPTQYRVLLNKEKAPKKEHPKTINVVPNHADVDATSRRSGNPEPTDEDTDLEALEQNRTVATVRTAPYSTERMRAEQSITRVKSMPITPEKTANRIILVTWYHTDDPANPKN